jgi:hypothetical protein
MMTNVRPAQCTRKCLKRGSDYALVSGGKVYTLKGDTKQKSGDFIQEDGR